MAKSLNQNSFRIRVSLVILLALLVTNTFERVQATCAIKDASGLQLSLNTLPDGVDYSKEYDRLRCLERNSCSGWEISDCAIVQCRNTNACLNAHMINNKGISCQEESSCRGGYLTRSHNVVCGLQALHTCQRATIESDTVILCFGPYACAQNEAENFMTISLGGKGILRCGSGDGDLTCQHIVVEVNHSKRACFAQSIQEPKGCAVICEGNSECDQASIQFRVRS